MYQPGRKCNKLEARILAYVGKGFATDVSMSTCAQHTAASLAVLSIYRTTGLKTDPSQKAVILSNMVPEL